MSSHHIVRDEQEPALIVTAGGLMGNSTLQALLEWSPIVVAFEEAIPELVALQMKIDWAVIPEDLCQNWEEQLSMQAPIEFVTFQGNTHRLTLILKQLAKKGHRAANVLHTWPMEELVNLVSAPPSDHPEIELVFYSVTHKVSLVKATYSKWLTAGQRLTVIPLDKQAWEINLDGQARSFSDEQRFQLEKEGMVRIASQEGRLLIQELL